MLEKKLKKLWNKIEHSKDCDERPENMIKSSDDDSNSKSNTLFILTLDMLNTKADKKKLRCKSLYA